MTLELRVHIKSIMITAMNEKTLQDTLSFAYLMNTLYSPEMCTLFPIAQMRKLKLLDGEAIHPCPAVRAQIKILPRQTLDQ